MHSFFFQNFQWISGEELKGAPEY